MIDDRVHAVLDRDGDTDLRFRASLITSATVHTLALVLLAFGPLLVPRPRILPSATPVTLVELAPERPPAPEPEPAAAVEEPEPEEAEPEPEPEEAPPREPEEDVAPTKPPEETPEPEPKETEPPEDPKPRTQTARRSSAEPAAPETQRAERSPSVGVLGAASGGQTVEDFPFAYYLEILRRRIAERWNPPSRGPYAAGLSAEYYFRIGRQGRLITLRKETASGHELFDISAERSIRSATFPPLPYGYDGSSLGIYLVFVDE